MKTRNRTIKDDENSLNVPDWTGKDVENLRTDFAPSGEKKITYETLAEMMGLKDKASIKRYEQQEELGALPTLAFELVRRILQERTAGIFRQLTDRLDTESEPLHVQTIFEPSGIKINVRQESPRGKILAAIRLEMSNGLFLIIEPKGKNKSPIEPIRLL